MQWARGAGQSHCFSCCGRRVKTLDDYSRAGSSATGINSLIDSGVVPKTRPTLNDFVKRITEMDSVNPDDEAVEVKHASAVLAVESNLAMVAVPDHSICASDHLSEEGNIDWNALFRAHLLQKVCFWPSL
jgi:hypothetical protein